MEAVESVLNEEKHIPPAEYESTASPDASSMNHADERSIANLPSDVVEQDTRATEKGATSISQDISDEKQSQKDVDYLVDNGDLKLELPETLDHEDFSKLLEFDEKNDDLFATQEILQHAIQEADSQSQNIEELNSNLSRQMSFKEDQDIDEQDANLDEDENADKSIVKNSHSSRIGSDTNDFTLKEETLSPRRTLSDSEQQNSMQHDEGGSNIDDEISKEASNDLEHIEPEVKKDQEPTAANLLGKGNLLQPRRHDSLTPVMFQKHELVTSHPGNVDSSRPILKEGSSPENLLLADEQPTISAYARLDFQSFTFYVQTLHVIIGRRSENDFSHKVDVNLGPSKSISRRHAQIFYNFGTGRFEVSIIGKNGAFVDDIFVERGNTVPLRNKTKVQIGQIPFQFILPEQEKAEQSLKSPELSKSVDPQESASPAKKEEQNQKVTEESGIKKQPKKQPVKKEKKPAKSPKKIYTLEEIPEEYRTKPTCSYSALLTTCIRKFSSPKGMSLSEIYSGIRELFPYYKYCPDGWQSSVRHNLSLNKSFRKVSKEGKGWLWGLDEEYIAERERQKKKQAEAAAAKAAAAQQRLEQQQQQRAKKAATSSGNAATVNRTSSFSRTTNGKQQSISQTLAANRAADKKPNIDDHQRTMRYLQEQLMILTKDRKGLSKQVIASILTQALAMTINQVSQAAKNKGITGNPLTALMDKNPQHLNLILAAAVNAATSKVTNGKVKQLVNMTQPIEMSKQAKKYVSTSPAHRPSFNNNAISRSAEAGKSSIGSKSGDSSFDPSSLSRFFQPRQPARATTPTTKTSIPQKRALEKDEETSDSEESSSSEEDDDDDESNDDDEETDDNADDNAEGKGSDKDSDNSSDTGSDDEDDDEEDDNNEEDNEDDQEGEERDEKDDGGFTGDIDNESLDGKVDEANADLK